jgi:hypothetical protein
VRRDKPPITVADIEAAGYEIRPDGVVVGVLKRKPMRTALVSGGYQSVGVYVNKIGYRKNVHALVAEKFLGPRPTGYQINHKNGIKTDNRPENLEYVTRSENQEHSARLGLRRYRLDPEKVREIRAIYATGVGSTTIARQYGVDESTCADVCLGRRWKTVV